MCRISCSRWERVLKQPGQRISLTSLSPLRIEQLDLPLLSGSFCPSPTPPTPGQPCNLPGALDCHYENHIDHHGLSGNCCCGQCDIDMTCAPNSTTGSGLWQPKHPVLCPTKGCGSEGEWWRENDPLTACYSQVLSARQASRTATLRTWQRQKRFKWRAGKY